jgi:hypothetical protein
MQLYIEAYNVYESDGYKEKKMQKTKEICFWT